ncbi:MAG: hypothetical protein ABL963_06900 [Longimicrobiales bacterium]
MPNTPAVLESGAEVVRSLAAARPRAVTLLASLVALFALLALPESSAAQSGGLALFVDQSRSTLSESWITGKTLGIGAVFLNSSFDTERIYQRYSAAFYLKTIDKTTWDGYEGSSNGLYISGSYGVVGALLPIEAPINVLIGGGAGVVGLIEAAGVAPILMGGLRYDQPGDGWGLLLEGGYWFGGAAPRMEFSLAVEDLPW